MLSLTALVLSASLNVSSPVPAPPVRDDVILYRDALRPEDQLSPAPARCEALVSSYERVPARYASLPVGGYLTRTQHR